MTGPFELCTLLHEVVEWMAMTRQVEYESSNVSQTTLKNPYLFEIFRGKHLLDYLYFTSSISMSLCQTIDPMNFPKVTPNAHLSGFIFS